MAGVLSKLDKKFNSYLKLIFEETIGNKQLTKQPETTSAYTQQLKSDVRKAIVEIKNCKRSTSDSQVRKHMRKVDKGINSNMAESYDVTTELNNPGSNVTSNDVNAAEGNNTSRNPSNPARQRKERTNSNASHTDSSDTRIDSHCGSNRNLEDTANNIRRKNASKTPQNTGSLVDQLGIVVSKPKHRLYATPDSRIKTYGKWPKEKKISVTTLVDAGFAYTGIGDSVRCFCCGGAFKDWSDESDPWKEHALHFPDCGHVRQCKGFAYIKHVLGEEDSDDEIEGDDDVVIDRVKLAMKRNEDAVMAARDFCSDENLLRGGIKRILKEKEKFTGVDLIKATEEMKEELERQKEFTKNAKTASLKNGDYSEAESERVELMEENEKLKDPVLCKICFDNVATIITLPCGHMASCSQCISALSSCALCRSQIKGTVRALMAV